MGMMHAVGWKTLEQEFQQAIQATADGGACNPINPM